MLEERFDMRRRIYIALASCVVALALAFAEPMSASAAHDGQHRQATKRARHRTRAQKKSSQHAVNYVCPMHPDIREKSRGTCPKCMMDLVAEPRGAKTGSAKTSNGTTGEFCCLSQGRP